MGDGKRLLGIVSSLRQGGNSEMLARLALGAAAERGAQVDLVFLKDLEIGFCDGCLSCVFRGGQCRYDDDVHWLYETAGGYDGLVLTSPTYLLGAPGQVKALVDRGVAEYARAPGRRETPIGVFCVAGLPDWDYLVRPVVNQLALLLGGKLVGSLMAYAPGPAEVLLDEDVVRRSRELGVAVLEDKPLSAPQGVCPVCYLPRPGRAGPCPFCLHDPADPDKPHRFTAGSLTHFLVDWMLPSRERFLAHKDVVKQARAAILEREVRELRPERVAAGPQTEGGSGR